VTLDFEMQEAVTFRDGAAQAFGELESALSRRDAKATLRLQQLLGRLGHDLSAAAAHTRVADSDAVEQTTDEALGLIDGLYPDDWPRSQRRAGRSTRRSPMRSAQSARARPPPRPWSRTRR
jgi:hypothetical protein